MGLISVSGALEEGPEKATGRVTGYIPFVLSQRLWSFRWTAKRETKIFINREIIYKSKQKNPTRSHLRENLEYQKAEIKLTQMLNYWRLSEGRDDLQNGN